MGNIFLKFEKLFHGHRTAYCILSNPDLHIEPAPLNSIPNIEHQLSFRNLPKRSSLRFRRGCGLMLLPGDLQMPCSEGSQAPSRYLLEKYNQVLCQNLTKKTRADTTKNRRSLRNTSGRSSSLSARNPSRSNNFFIGLLRNSSKIFNEILSIQKAETQCQFHAYINKISGKTKYLHEREQKEGKRT